MGDIAEMMLDGTLCEGCGEYLEGVGEGFPRYCSACRRQNRYANESFDRPQKRVKCTFKGCRRRFTNTEAMEQHSYDKHGTPSPKGAA